MDLSQQILSILQKIKYYLIVHVGKTIEEASLEEFYLAFCSAFRERIMINWTSCLHTFEQKKAKTLYYFSMEYLPGKLLENNTNISTSELVQGVLEKTKHSLKEVLELEPDPGLGNGGLGRLASCFLDSLATLEYPAWGYGLRYQYGIFEQEVWDGKQIERPDCWLLNTNPWEFRKDGDATTIHFRGTPIAATNSHGEEVLQLEDFEEIRALPYDIPILGPPKQREYPVISLRLWSTKESPKNFELQRYNAGQLDQAGENTSLTDVLYPNDHHEIGKRIRLKQEFLLVSASVQDILKRHLRIHDTLENFSDKVRIQINDTHPALVIVELTRRLMKDHDMPLDKAWEITQACCSYTNHTILREALEEWNEKRMSELLPRQYQLIQRLNFRFCSDIRKRFPGEEDRVQRMSFIEKGQIKMAHLCIYGCHKINGVAKLHTDILKKRIFPDFFEMYPERFTSVTNGVTQRRWLLNTNPLLSQWITSLIGDKWITHFSEIAKLHELAHQSPIQQAFLEIKKKNREKFLYFLQTGNPLRDAKGKAVGHFPCLEANSLIDVQIKRIHEYKRPLLNLLHTLMLYQELKEKTRAHPVPRMVVFGGKAAPGYVNAKVLIQLIYALCRKINQDPEVNTLLKVVFIENYNVSKAQMILPAADLSQQISLAGMEASGTGNMKLAMNGALTIGTRDGANIEMQEVVGETWWPFSFGSSAEEIAEARKNHSYQPEEIYQKNPTIQKAVDTLKDGSLAKNEEEATAFSHLYTLLLEGHSHRPADPYFILKDLPSYYETQKKVEALFLDPLKWAEYTLHNIASMGPFSSDQAISQYAEQIWGLTPCPFDPALLQKVKQEFSQPQIL